jgi:hypothetical protein
VQTLFMNVMAMHSKLVKYIQEQEDARVHYEGLQVNPVPRVYVPSYCIRLTQRYTEIIHDPLLFSVVQGIF